MDVDVEEGRPHEYSASLRVFSDTRPLSDLVARLGSSSGGYEIGDPVSSRLLGRTHGQSMWRLESSVDRLHRLEEHIEELVGFVEKHQDRFVDLRADCHVDIFCGVFSGSTINGGFVLEPSLAGRLNVFRLPVVVEVY